MTDPPWFEDKAAVASAKRWFVDWLSVAQFREMMGLVEALAGDRVIDHPRLGFWKDAWIAAKFADQTGASDVRLVEPDPPDFEVRMPDGVILRCEATEVLRPGRRRGDEFKADRLLPHPALRHDPEEDWADADQVADAVVAAIQAKARKGYLERFTLVIYVNAGFVHDEDRLSRRLGEIEDEGHPAFSRIVILGK